MLRCQRMRVDCDITALVDHIVAGRRIEPDQALKLFELPLRVLGQLAQRRRDLATTEAYNGQGRRIVTYVVDRNINFTNVCVTRCRFCAFARAPADPDAYVLSRSELDRKIEEALALGATQILLQGGHHPGLGLDWYLDLLHYIKSRFPGVNIHGFSPPEVVFLARQTGLGVQVVLQMLRDAGLGSLPGGGAEILVDRVRQLISPRKASSAEWLEVMDAAHELGLYTSATMMFGHVETRAERIEHLERIRRLQDRALARQRAADPGADSPSLLQTNNATDRAASGLGPPPGPGCFISFTCWTYQASNTVLGGTGVGAAEYLRTLAIARIYLDNFRNIQSSWVTQGAEVGQVALLYGANDFGSVMLEENVVRAAGAIHRLSEPEIRALISELGYTPRRRDTWYRLVD